MRRRLAVGTLGALAVAAALLACGPKRLPAPPYVQQPAEALNEVPYAPPPARIEFIPDRPKDDRAVWIDGEWSWQGRRWAWKHGRWVVPPPNTGFAPWTTARGAMGTLYFASGAFRDSHGAEVPEPAPISTSRLSPGGVVDPGGSQVPAATLQTGTGPAFDASLRAVQQFPEAGLDDVTVDADINDSLVRPDAVPLPADGGRIKP